MRQHTGDVEAAQVGQVVRFGKERLEKAMRMQIDHQLQAIRQDVPVADMTATSGQDGRLE